MKTYFEDPYIFYYRKLKYYPIFIGEAYTHPFLKRLIGTKLNYFIVVYRNGVGYSVVEKKIFKDLAVLFLVKLKASPHY